MDKILIVTKKFYYFNYTLYVSAITLRAGHESPEEDCGWPHQTVGVNRQFLFWLHPRQRHNRHNPCCQAAVREVASCLHGLRRPGDVC